MYYRQPRYFNDFQCVGGTCPNSCCIGWRIDWTQEEIDKVKNAPDCSPELKSLCEKSFEYNTDTGKNNIILGDKERCPFLTNDDFCRIQRELGVAFLSHTCTIYPRKRFVTGSTLYRFCHMSCPEVLKKLLNDEKSTDLVNVSIKREFADYIDQLDDAQHLKNFPERKYSGEIIEFFYEIISEKKRSLENSIVLGALAAKSLTQLISNKQYEKIPEALKSFRLQFNNSAQLKTIENISPNYNIKFGLVDKIIKELFTTTVQISCIDDEGKLNIDIYNQAEKMLKKEFENRQFAWRNMALNLLLELIIPFTLEDKSIFENYSLFVIAYAFIRYNVLTIVEFNNRVSEDKHFNVDEVIIKFNAILSRKLCHNKPHLEKLLQDMQKYNMTSPAYLALLVK